MKMLYQHFNVMVSSMSFFIDLKTTIIIIRIIGMPSALARHFGSIFMRDPLVIIKEQMYATDGLTSYHFEVCFFFLSSSNTKEKDQFEI